MKSEFFLLNMYNIIFWIIYIKLLMCYKVHNHHVFA